MSVDIATAPTAPPPSSRAWRILAFALRDLRGGLQGFYVFVACVALGVAIITGVGALTDALRAGFERQGEVLLGGDAALSRPHRRAEPAERAWMETRGRVSETVTLRAMARRLDGGEQLLVELKGVDQSYPLAGAVRLSDGAGMDTAVTQGAGAAVDPILLERLGLGIGDRMQLGNGSVEIRAVIQAEPDKIAGRLSFGPRVFVSLATLEQTGLAGPGSLVRWRYALQLAGGDGAAEAGLLRFRDQVKTSLPDAGFTVADRRDPHPRVTRTLERLRQFLTLIGLTSLLVGGVGVANAVATYIDRRRKIIATFKSLGATSGLIFSVHLAQVMLIAGVGVLIGLVLGLLLPFLLTGLLAGALPIQAEISVRPASILIAVAYGLLVALLFTLWPMGRAELVPAAVLFRDEVAPERVWPRWPVILATGLVAAALVVLALATSESQRIAVYFCLSMAGIFAVFIALGFAATALARRLPRPRQAELALALGSVGAPGGLTRSVVLSLGTGLSLLVAVALANTSIVSELSTRLPKNSPDYFVMDIPPAEIESLTELIGREAPGAHINQAPMLRGRVVRLGDRPADQIKAPPEAAWVLTGDRGLTYAEDIPEGSSLAEGTWWPADYAGEPLVSFEAELAQGLGVGIGDTVTVNVMGRNLTARIANLRDVRWESLAINFVMVFSPNSLRGAPHNLLATVTLPGNVSLAGEASLAKAIGRAHPATATLRVRDAINAFNTIFERIMTAVQVAGGVTLAAGALVLAGALATAQRRRIREAVILKALGATRARILRAHLLEYAMLAGISALFATGLGTLAAWIAVTQVMELSFEFSWIAVAQALGLALLLIAVLGGIGTARVLRAPPVPYLRAE